MPAGRPKKPRAVHELEGTLNVTRHNKPSVAMVTADGAPRMPADLEDDAKALWVEVCRRQKCYLSEADATALRALCETWHLRNKALQLAKDDPTDKDSRCSYIAYHSACEKLLGKFGMTPSDRARLGEVSKEDSDPAAEFIA